MDTRWKHRWVALVSGPSQAGKSVFVKKFLQHLDVMSDTKFAEIYLSYGEWQPMYSELEGKIEFREGVPKTEDF